MPPLECRDLEETLIHAYVDGEFSPEESAEVEQHLKGCAACTHTVRFHSEYKLALNRANVAAPHSLHDAVREDIANEPRAGRWAAVLRRPGSIAAVAAAVGAAAWFLAGGLQHPLWPQRRSIVDDGIALHARALPLDFTASDSVSAQRWLSDKL